MHVSMHQLAMELQWHKHKDTSQKTCNIFFCIVLLLDNYSTTHIDNNSDATFKTSINCVLDVHVYV